MTSKAFRRRPEQDADGLSVGSSHEAAKQLQRSGRGVAKLAITEIEAINLQVIPENDDHGFIRGIPDESPETYDQVIELAEKLLERSSITIDPWRRHD